MRSLLAISALSLLCACELVSGLDDFGVAETSSSTAAGGSGGHAGEGGNGHGGSGGAGGGSAGEGGSGGSAGEGGGGGSAGEGGSGGAPIPTACDDVQGPSGVYLIDPNGEGGTDPFDAFCEMAIGGGGWTLVGRTAPGGSGDFGWYVDVGTVQNPSVPYSLNTDRVDLVFTEILLVARDADPQAYLIDSVPADFLADFEQSPFSTAGKITAVLGDCAPNGGPAMLQNMGFTDRDDMFFVRDANSPDGTHGLRPHGWVLNGTSDCNYEGDLGGQQGEIYVR